MVEIGFAGGPLLAAMCLHGIDIGAVEKILIRIGVIFRDPLHQFILAHHSVSLRKKKPGTSPGNEYHVFLNQ